jgi:hypothetical protein
MSKAMIDPVRSPLTDDTGAFRRERRLGASGLTPFWLPPPYLVIERDRVAAA